MPDPGSPLADEASRFTEKKTERRRRGKGSIWDDVRDALRGAVERMMAPWGRAGGAGGTTGRRRPAGMSRTTGPNPASSPNPAGPVSHTTPASPGARPPGGAAPASAPTGSGQGPVAGRTTKESIQDTIISVIIAFALAFVFRGFVVEAFVIPTGSMAPTLMGAHERFRSRETGYTWQVGPWDIGPRGEQDYLPIQGRYRPIKVHDPMSGQVQTSPPNIGVPRLSGDRILVLKYL